MTIDVDTLKKFTARNMYNLAQDHKFIGVLTEAIQKNVIQATEESVRGMDRSHSQPPPPPPKTPAPFKGSVQTERALAVQKSSRSSSVPPVETEGSSVPPPLRSPDGRRFTQNIDNWICRDIPKTANGAEAFEWEQKTKIAAGITFYDPDREARGDRGWGGQKQCTKP